MVRVRGGTKYQCFEVATKKFGVQRFYLLERMLNFMSRLQQRLKRKRKSKIRPEYGWSRST